VTEADGRAGADRDRRRMSTQDGLRLAYRDTGEPPDDPDASTDGRAAATPGMPVLCLAGLARHGADFAAVAERLAPRRRVLRPDYIGRGDSDRAADWRRYRPLRMVQDVGDLLTAAGPSRVAILGTSLGGLLAMGLAVARPTLVGGVLLNDVGPDLDPSGLPRIAAYIRDDEPLPDWDAAVAKLQRMMPDLSVGRPEEAGWAAAARATWRECADGRLRYDFDTRLADTLEADDDPPPDLWALFDALAAVPLAIVRGARSDVLSSDTLARMQARRPDAIVAEVPGVGHAPNLDEPESREALDAFLARCDAAAG